MSALSDAQSVVLPLGSFPAQCTRSRCPEHGKHQHIARHGRMSWQTASGYNRRARVEASMNRWKQMIGDEVRAHTDERRATEAAVAVHALNRMLDMGRSNYVRVA